MKDIKVFCPGSLSNIYCGFDILGLCLNNIGDEITAKPKPKIPCMAALANKRIEIKIISSKDKSNGYVN